MRTILLAAAALGFAIAAPAFASAQTAPVTTLVDCMQRDGGPTGCTSPYQEHTPGYYYRNGARQTQSDANAYYAPREHSVR